MAKKRGRGRGRGGRARGSGRGPGRPRGSSKASLGNDADISNTDHGTNISEANSADGVPGESTAQAQHISQAPSLPQKKKAATSLSPRKNPTRNARALRPGQVTLKLSSLELREKCDQILAGTLRIPVDINTPGSAPAEAMAPLNDNDRAAHEVLDDHMRDVIQNFYDIGNIAHGYQNDSQEPIVQKGIDLTRSLSALSSLTAPSSTHPASSKIRSILIPPEVIEYVAAGRNPDIYTRDFVENVQRGNRVLAGKMDAFASFAEVYARETKSAIPELSDDMDRIMEKSDAFEKGEDGVWKKKVQSNGGKPEMRNGKGPNLNGA